MTEHHARKQDTASEDTASRHTVPQDTVPPDPALPDTGAQDADSSPTSLPYRDRWSYAWLGLAALLGIFSTGRWTAPLAVWLTSVFLIRFFRTQRPVRAWLAAAPAIALSFYVGWRGLIPFGGDGAFLGMAVAAGFIGGLPFLADRVLHHRLGALARTLVFPSLVTALEFLGTLGGDLTGSWGATAYTQSTNVGLLQLASVTGLWGITFLVSWFPTVVNHLWERDFDIRRARVPVAAFAGVLAVVLLGGQLRLALPDETAPSVRAALVAEPALSGPDGFWPGGDVARRYYTGSELTEVEWQATQARMDAIHERLFAASEREAAAGARMIFWAEANAQVRSRDEAEFLARAEAFAARHDVHLGVSLLVLPDLATDRLQNKVVFVTPTAGVAGEYHKSIPVPGFEATLLDRGDGRPAVWDTPYGRVAVVICYDLDFPRLIREVGRAGADILVGPSNDWQAIAPLHLEMARFRAVEQGVTLLRPATGGTSAAIGPYGRTLAALDFRSEGDRSVGVVIPTRRTPTAYTLLGDVAGWISVGASLLFLAVGFRAMRRARRIRRKTGVLTAGGAPAEVAAGS